VTTFDALSTYLGRKFITLSVHLICLQHFRRDAVSVSSSLYNECYVVDYLHPDDVADADSSSELLEPGRLEAFVPPPGRRRPHSNVIQPLVELPDPSAALQGPEDGGNVWKRGGEGGDGDAEGGGTVAPADDDKDTGYSSGTDDADDDDN